MHIHSEIHTEANPPRVHVHGYSTRVSTRFARLCELPLCRSIPGVEGEDRFGGKNVSVCSRAYIGIPCQSRVHCTVWNFGYKRLKGLITCAPISGPTILTPCRLF